MSASNERAIVQAASTGRDASAAARPTSAQDAPPSALRLGKVSAVASGAYTVDLIGATGTVVDSIPGVRVWGDAEFTVGQRVTVAYFGDRPVPWIIGGGGGSGDIGESIATPLLGFLSE